MSLPRAIAQARRAAARGERGIAAVEMAALLPLLALLLCGAIDFGRIFHAYVVTGNAAQQAATYAGRFYVPVLDVTTATLNAIVTTESGGFLVTGTGTAANTTVTGPTMVTGVQKVPLVQVQVTYSFRPLTPLPLGGPIPIRVTATSPLPGQVL